MRPLASESIAKLAHNAKCFFCFFSLISIRSSQPAVGGNNHFVTAPMLMFQVLRLNLIFFHQRLFTLNPRICVYFVLAALEKHVFYFCVDEMQILERFWGVWGWFQVVLGRLRPPFSTPRMTQPLSRVENSLRSFICAKLD